MEKSKLGIPVTLLAGAACLLGLYGGYIILGILVGYVLLKEEDLWLKKFCVKVLALMLAFSLASTVLGLIPDLLHILYSFLEIFRVNIYLSVIHNIFNLFGNALSLLKVVLFLLLALTAFTGKNIKIPVVDPFLDKHIG